MSTARLCKAVAGVAVTGGAVQPRGMLVRGIARSTGGSVGGQTFCRCLAGCFGHGPMVPTTGTAFDVRSYFKRSSCLHEECSTTLPLAPPPLSKNRFSKLRRSLAVFQPDETDGYNDCAQHATRIAEQTFSVLAATGRSWKRLRHVVDLACSYSVAPATITTDRRKPSIADVGCDHGLLSLALACSTQFQSVVGVDVSERALQDGAHYFHKKLLEALAEQRFRPEEQSGSPKLPASASGNTSSLFFVPVEFRVGDGIRPLRFGEADTICIAGVGVPTLMQILFPSPSPNFPAVSLEDVGCKLLIVQPTNSRPRNLTRLYHRLAVGGGSLSWRLLDERIELIGSRFYISSAFGSVDSSEFDTPQEHSPLPGLFLHRLDENSTMYNTYQDYVNHHVSWLQKDQTRKASLAYDDLRWLKWISDGS